MTVADFPVFDGDRRSDKLLADSHATFRTLRDLGDAVWLSRLRLVRGGPLSAGAGRSARLGYADQRQGRCSERIAEYPGFTHHVDLDHHQ
jgi:hypothetical protein